MTHNDSTAICKNQFSINENNRVAGFDPLRFLKLTANGPKLALDTKKVWFRLKYPEGRIILRPINITEQMALIEARVFLHKTDPDPSFVSTVQKMLNEVPGGLYVQAAQHDAVEQVLDEAGFTIQSKSNPTANTVREQPVVLESIADTIQTATNVILTQESIPISAEKVNETDISQSGIAKTAVERTVMVEPTVAELIPEATEEQVVSASEKAEEHTEVTSTVSVVTEETIEEHHAQILEVTLANAEEVTDEVPTDAVPYTMSTPVDEICEKMSLQEALDYIITTGSCKGWTMSQAIARRPASVKFYLTPGYKGEDNILRASAKIVLDNEEKLAS